MSETNQELVSILQEQIAIEEQTLNDLHEAEENAKEVAVRLVFMEMRLDTWKHMKFLEGMIEMMEKTPCDRWSAKVQRYVDRVKLSRQLDSFIAQESKMIDLLDKALEQMKDPIGILLLQHLREDETRHHTDLEEITRLVNMQPLQTVKGVTGSDIVCEEPEDE
jgi:bacterioferritin (cytochrome b1)